MKLTLSACFLALLLLSACETVKYVAVPVDYNPKLYFKPDTTIIVLVNQFDPMRQKMTNRKLLVIKAGAHAALKSAQAQLQTLPHVKVVNLVDSADLKVNTDPVKSLALKYHADYVLSLINFYAGIDLNDVSNYTASYASNVGVSFLLSEPNGIYTKKLDGQSSEPQSNTVSFGLLTDIITKPTVGGNKQSIILATEHATQAALQDYFPYTLTFQRPLYNDTELQPMVISIFNQKFDIAYKQAEPLLKSTNAQLASRAMYNLAVVYESQGDIDLAIDMAQQSVNKQSNEFATIILNDLKKE